MPASICPRCKHYNPEYATYCYFDGVVLQAQQQQDGAVHRLPSEFAFPSGRRCKTYDELAQGCQEEWTAARDLLMRGVFTKYFQTANRADLVRAANDAKSQTNPDIALTTFLSSLPGTRTQTPKLDLSPRRILLGKVSVGDSKTIPLTITNQGQGMLQGTVTVSEGQDWLSLSESKALHLIEVNTVREQVIKLTINTKGVAAGQAYAARLTVVTNGGVVEVPLRMELAPQPFGKAPFQGVRTQRELAEKMRLQPKAAVPILESGEVQRWFVHNGWNYPIVGQQIKGVAGVQQFFEGMGVSKPPVVQLSQKEMRFTCKYKEVARGQVTLQTAAKKWVYSQITSDSPWLKTPNPQVSGPQRATIPLEFDSTLWNGGTTGEGKLLLVANGGQKLTLKVIVEVQGAPAGAKPRPSAPAPVPAATHAPTAAIASGPPPSIPIASMAPQPAIAAAGGGVKFIPALVTMVLVCLALRCVMVPLVDMKGRASVARDAASKLGMPPTDDSELAKPGGWLQLPWLPILSGADTTFSAEIFQPGNSVKLKTLEFRHYFASYFIRWFVLGTFWIGALIGAFMVMRRGGVTDIPWGIVAGAIAGLAGSATVGAFILVVEMLPHMLYHLVRDATGDSLFLWMLVAILCWLGLGIVLGIILPCVGPLRRLLVDPFQGAIAGLMSALGMKSLGTYWAPN